MRCCDLSCLCYYLQLNLLPERLISVVNYNNYFFTRGFKIVVGYHGN